MKHRAQLIKRCLLVLGAWLMMSTVSVQAAGPFVHLEFAHKLWPAAAAKLGLATQTDILRGALYAGALAPDAGNYLPGARGLAEAVHLIKPGELAAAMMDMAKTPREKAFAVGWLSHINLDRLLYANALNPLAGGDRWAKPARHLGLQWGMDCTALSGKDSAWLWTATPDVKAGLNLWARAMAKVYQAKVSTSKLLAAQKAQAAEVKRLPEYFWLTGQTSRPGHFWGNVLGESMGRSVRPLLLAWYKWTGTDPAQTAKLEVGGPLALGPHMTTQLMALSTAQVLALLEGGRLPPGNAYAYGACDKGDCPQVKAAKEWLARSH